MNAVLRLLSGGELIDGGSPGQGGKTRVRIIHQRPANIAASPASGLG
jgi:hypothetical protein